MRGGGGGGGACVLGFDAWRGGARRRRTLACARRWRRIRSGEKARGGGGGVDAVASPSSRTTAWREGRGRGERLTRELEGLRRHVEEVTHERETTTAGLRDVARMLVQRRRAWDFDGNESGYAAEVLDDLHVTFMNAANIRKEHALALRVFGAMLSKSRTEPSVRAYSAAVRAAANVELDMSGYYGDEERASDARLQVTRKRGDRRHPLAAALCSALVARMRRSGMAAGVNVYCLAAEACAKTARWESAVVLLRDVRDGRRLPLNRALYGSAIRACGNAGEWERALLLLLSMRQNCVGADAVVASDVVGILWDAGRRRQALSLMHLWQRRWTLQTSEAAASAAFVLVDLHGLSPGAACVQVAQLLLALRARLDAGDDVPSAVVVVTGRFGSVRGSSRLRLEVLRFLSEIGCAMMKLAPDNDGRLECEGSALWTWLARFNSRSQMEAAIVEDRQEVALTEWRRQL